MSADWLKDIRERAEAATPGPWNHDADENVVFTTRGAIEIADIYSGAQAKTNAAFVAGSRRDIPRLLAVAEAADALADAADGFGCVLGWVEGSKGLQTCVCDGCLLKRALAAYRKARK